MENSPCLSRNASSVTVLGAGVSLSPRGAALVGGSLSEHHIPPVFLSDDAPLPSAPEETRCGTKPLLAFMNPKSGDGASALLGEELRVKLGAGQVFDLTQHDPEEVLRVFHARVERRRMEGVTTAAADLTRTLTLLVAGGDGSMSWVLNSVRSVWAAGQRLPAVLPVPLGTANDMARSLGWGGTVQKWQLSSVLYRLKKASPTNVDTWRVQISTKEVNSQEMQLVDSTASSSSDQSNPLLDGAQGSGSTPVAGMRRSSSYPYTLQQSVSEAGHTTLKGSFWNYFSIGMDAAAAQGFLSWRESHPWTTGGLLINSFWYTLFACANGGWCTEGIVPRLKPFLRVRVRRRPNGPWADVPLPEDVRALVLLNLGSYGAGRDIWGRIRAKATKARKRVRMLFSQGSLNGSKGKQAKRAATAADSQVPEERAGNQGGAMGLPPTAGGKTPKFADGKLEMVGIRNGWHGGAIMVGLTHGKRIAQACEISIELSGNNAQGKTYMQVDGDAWVQPLPPPASKHHVFLHIAHSGVGRLCMKAEERLVRSRSKSTT